MQCPNCGAELKPGSKFCGKCGTTVNAPAPAPTVPSPAPAPTRPAPAHVAPAAAPAAAPSRPAATAPAAPRGHYNYDVIACRKYFANKSIVKYLVIAIVAVLLIFIAKSDAVSIIALLVAVVAAVAAYMVRGTVNDTQIEQIYAGISQIALAEASQKMGISHEDSSLAKPYTFEGFCLDDVPCTCFARTGADGVVRTSNYQVTVMYAGKDAMHCYTVNQSLTLKARTPRTSDIFYDEVVRMRIVEPETETGRADASFFELELRSGKTYYVSFLPSQRKYALALRTLLREKKAESGRLAKAQLEALKSL